MLITRGAAVAGIVKLIGILLGFFILLRELRKPEDFHGKRSQ